MSKRQPARQVIVLYERGANVPTISKAIGMNERQVKAIIQSHVSGDPKFKKALEMREAGLTGPEIAQVLGCSRQYIHKLLGSATASIPIRVSPSRTLLDTEDMESLRAIAEDFGFIVKNGVRAGEGNVNLLMHHIAIGNLSVVKTKYF